MSNQERYWMNAAIYVCLASTFQSETLLSEIASTGCLILSAGYLAAMIWNFFCGDKK